VIIVGAGTSETVSTQASNPDLPNQNVSVIARQSQGKTVTINDSEVALQNLNVFGGWITANNADLSMKNVLVNGVTGFYGVLVNHSSFSILDSKIVTQPNTYSDIGLYVYASAGFFTNSYVGSRFDHAITIEPWGCPDVLKSEGVCTGEEKVDVYNLPIPINIYITGATVEGSPIYYADGIRVSGPANVVIKNSKISRAAGGEPANKGSVHNKPYAGIEVGGWILADNTTRRVEIIGNDISGFDVGIGVNISTLQLKVEGNKIQGLSYGVDTSYYNYTGTTHPSVDFGGGPLGSIGKNTFSDQPKYAYFHDTGPYDVWACYNNWMVASSNIDPMRIYDKLDKSSLGRIKWDCTSSGAATSQSGLTVVTPTYTPFVTTLVAIPTQNANCRLGNSASVFDIADTLYAGEQYTPVGRGPDNLWLAFIGPTYAARCWVYVDTLTLLFNGEETDPENIPEGFLPVILYPPRPTPTFTPEPVEPEPQEPPPPDLPACSDGIDNDGDGLIDMADGRCLTPDGDFEG
jgi:hypothetical protein